MVNAMLAKLSPSVFKLAGNAEAFKAKVFDKFSGDDGALNAKETADMFKFLAQIAMTSQKALGKLAKAKVKVAE